MDKEQLFETLSGLLVDVLRARFEGTAREKLCRAHGYADGYMRALLDAGLVDRDTLIALVCDTRRRYVEQDSVSFEVAPAAATEAA